MMRDKGLKHLHHSGGIMNEPVKGDSPLLSYVL